jgi:LemA protein
MEYVVFGLVIVIGLYFISIYNNLVKYKNQLDNTFSQIEVQLKRRYDLIPNLIEVAKGYMKHEKETLEAVIAARNEAQSSLNGLNQLDTTSIENFNQAEQGLVSSLGKMSFVMEDYPDLKANENMMQLHEELSTTENRIAFSRQAFNDAVMVFNTYRQSFPQNMLASKFGFMHDAMNLEFEDSQEIKKAPKVSF